MGLSAKLFVISLVITVTIANPARRRHKEDCAIVCTADFTPVCGSYGYTQKTFSNECQMDVASCQERVQYVKEYDGECGSNGGGCEKACGFVYKPVCGTYGYTEKTFSNDCEMAIASCKEKIQYTKKHNGECAGSNGNGSKTECGNIACAANYAPVCGSYGYTEKTFSNDCQMSVASCQEKIQYTKKHNGECGSNGNGSENKCINMACLANYAPVCGAYGYTEKTFSNECHMEVTSCQENKEYRKKYDGECGSGGGTKKCNTICTFEYRPVCGSSGYTQKTFSNGCQMISASCEENIQYTKLHNGECGGERSKNGTYGNRETKLY